MSEPRANESFSYSAGDLDRLVDGDLSEADRRRLLEQIDRHSDGWRSCALAFLEAQCWQQSLRDWSPVAAPPVSELPPLAAPPQKPLPAGPARWTPSRWTTLLAMAASMMIAFGFGTAWRNYLLGPKPTASSRLPVTSPVSTPTAAQSAQRQALARPWTTPVGAGYDGDPEGYVTMNVQGQVMNIPVYAWSGSADEMPLPQAEMSELLRNLRRDGHDVRSVGTMVPVVIDGRQVMLPMEQIEIVPVGGRTYQ